MCQWDLTWSGDVPRCEEGKKELTASDRASKSDLMNHMCTQNPLFWFSYKQISLHEKHILRRLPEFDVLFFKIAATAILIHYMHKLSPVKIM